MTLPAEEVHTKGPVHEANGPVPAPSVSTIYRRFMARAPGRPSHLLFCGLMLLAATLTAGSVMLGGVLLFQDRSVAPPAGRRAAVPYAGQKDLWAGYGRCVVQEDGRTKPFDTFCREAVRTVTGRERFEGNDPVAVVVSWLLSAGDAQPPAPDCDWDQYPFILCDYRPLRELLYQEAPGRKARMTEEERHGRYIEPAVLRRSQELDRLTRRAAARRSEDSKASLSPLEQKAKDVKKRLDLYERIGAGDGFGLAALDRHGPAWFSLKDLRDFDRTSGQWQEVLSARAVEHSMLYKDKPEQPFPAAAVRNVLTGYNRLQEGYRSGDEARFAAASARFVETVAAVSRPSHGEPGTDTIGRELWYNQTNPFGKAWLTGLLAAVILTVSLLTSTWRRTSRVLYVAGLLAYAGALAWAVTGFYCRVSISGRPPVSNMYESIIWVAFMAACFGLVLELVYRRRVIGLAGALVSTLGFVLADQLPLTFSPAIQPLQAVLRSNYWLVIHVLTIVSSYAAFALAWGLGNFTLAVAVLVPRRRDLVRTLAQFVYRAIQIGVVLLAAGTLLGGFWAAESWGRFWGWDPKEVWALIALLSYIIPLHARYVGWVKDFGLAVCSVVCFASVVMAWYGVNFVLGAGLHSYGFGGGRDAWVYAAGLLNIDLVVLAGLRYMYAGRAAGCAQD
jgi:ABC-type transport system involved in cytochrome c biogenesis permease subunit